jgi:hypothetical protein
VSSLSVPFAFSQNPLGQTICRSESCAMLQHVAKAKHIVQAVCPFTRGHVFTLRWATVVTATQNYTLVLLSYVHN